MFMTVYTAANGTGFSSLVVNTVGPGLNTTSETDSGHFDNKKYEGDLQWLLTKTKL